MNIRKTISQWLLKPEVDRLRSLTQEAVDNFRIMPYLAAREPQALIEQLSEADPRLVDMLIRQLRDYDTIAGGGVSEQIRVQAVQECRSLYLNDPMTQFAVELWTDYAFGQSPTLTADDPQAQEVWDAFWQSDANAVMFGERRLHKLSEDELNDGELFFVFLASTIDGETTCRTVPTEQIKEIVKDPDDSKTVLYYRRDFTQGDSGAFNSIYYPDWAATDDQLSRAKLPPDAIRADTARAGTDVVMLQAAFREVGGRGWPLATASIDWTRAYKGFLQDRAAVAKAAAAIVEKYKVKGGQRAVDAMRRALGTSLTGGSGDAFETNPPPVAGSGWLENEAVDRQWMNRPTNSADAEKDGAALKKQAALGYKLYPHFLGDGDYYRLATATAMEGPTLRSFNRYQNFWSSVWKDMFKIVCAFAEEYGNKSFRSLDVEVSSSRVIGLSVDEISKVMTSVNDMLDRGIIDTATAFEIDRSLLRSGMDTLGIDSGTILDDAEVPPEPEPTPPPVIVQQAPPAIPPDQVPPDQTSQTDQNQEAGVSKHPFEEIADSIDRYRTSLRGPVYGLWSGKISREEFTEMMEIAIDVGLKRAWLEGLEKAGITEEDITQEDETARGEFVLEQFNHLSGFADFIEANSKAKEGALAGLQYRLAMWVNSYSKAVMEAFKQAKANPLCVWIVGPTEQSCGDCQYAKNKIYRKSVWIKWGWETQSQDLECTGYNCQCSLDPAPPGSKANKGHPRRPKGK